MTTGNEVYDTRAKLDLSCSPPVTSSDEGLGHLCHAGTPPRSFHLGTQLSDVPERTHSSSQTAECLLKFLEQFLSSNPVFSYLLARAGLIVPHDLAHPHPSLLLVLFLLSQHAEICPLSSSRSFSPQVTAVCTRANRKHHFLVISLGFGCSVTPIYIRGSSDFWACSTEHPYLPTKTASRRQSVNINQAICTMIRVSQKRKSVKKTYETSMSLAHQHLSGKDVFCR